MKKQRNWALLADYFDRSLMRNKLVLSLGNSSVFSDGIKWTPSGQHVEVYLNDAYVGVYLLTEDIRIDPARLDIKKMSSSAAVNDLDGGYIVEVDVRLDCFNDGVINLQHRTPQGLPVCQDTPDEGSITQNQLAYIMNLLDSVEQDLFGAEEDGPDQSGQLRRLVSHPGAVPQQRRRLRDQRLHVEGHRRRGQPGGPPAQHGSALGFRSFRGQHELERQLEDRRLLGQQVAASSRPTGSPSMFDNPRLSETWCCRAGSRSGPALAKFINSGIDTYARRLELPAQRNFAVWQIFDVPLFNYYIFSSHAEEVAFLKSYLNERMAWLDMAYATPESFAAMCK